jgi:heat shock protein HtpX
MAVQTFHGMIARNKRNSLLLVGLFVVFFIGLGLLIGTVWGGGGEQGFHFGVMVAIFTGILAFFLTMASWYSGSQMLMGVAGAKEIRKADDPELFNVVEEMTLAGGLPMPRMYLIRDTAMNAFATGRDPKHASVAITTGLRNRLTRDELQGVMAHELSHVRHYDIRYAMLMAVLVGTVVILCDLFLRSLWFGAGRRRRSSRDSGGGAQAILMIVAIVLAILAPILAKIIQLALSRQREYLADAGAVELTRNPDGLSSALAKLSGDTEVLEAANRATAPLFIVQPILKARGREDRGSLLATHPPIGERIKRLQTLGQ